MAELSVRYAVALFDIAQESGKLDEYIAQSIMLRDALSIDKCMTLLAHPSILDKEKLAFLNTVFTGQINEHMFGFLTLAITKNREQVIIPALDHFIEMGNRYNRKVTAEVTAAKPLNESQLASLKKILSKKLNKQVELTVNTDPTVIGGMYIRVDGYLLDFTIKLQLQDMTNSIKRSWSNDLKTG